jgi:hypothetical protein
MGVKELFREVYIGDIDLSYRMLKRLPDDLPDEVQGYFNCSYNPIKSLVGCPRIINGNFYARSTCIKTLEGGPRVVTGDYICSYNELDSLDGLPDEILGDLYLGPLKEGVNEDVDRTYIRLICNVKGSVCFGDKWWR